MKAIIHIGIEKTGSTTLQEFIVRNQNLLHQQGIAVLQSAGGLSDRALATYAMDNDLVDDHVISLEIENPDSREAWRREFRDSFCGEIGQLGSNIHSVILSSEHLHSRLRSSESIARLHDLLCEVFSQFQIVVYLRRQDRLAVSSFSTYYKAGGAEDMSLTARRQANFDEHFYAFDQLLEKWSSVFGRTAMVPRIFAKKDFQDGNLLRDFMEATGIEKMEDAYEYPGRQNVALSLEAIEVLRSFNTYLPSLKNDDTSKYYFNLRQKLIRRLERKHAGTPSIATQDEARRFYSQFKTANNRVAREWFGKQYLFDEDFSMYPKRLEDLAIDSSLLDTLIQFMRDELLLQFTSSDDPAALNDSDCDPNELPDKLSSDLAENEPDPRSASNWRSRLESSVSRIFGRS